MTGWSPTSSTKCIKRLIRNNPKRQRVEGTHNNHLLRTYLRLTYSIKCMNTDHCVRELESLTGTVFYYIRTQFSDSKGERISNREEVRIWYGSCTMYKNCLSNPIRNHFTFLTSSIWSRVQNVPQETFVWNSTPQHTFVIQFLPENPPCLFHYFLYPVPYLSSIRSLFKVCLGVRDEVGYPYEISDLMWGLKHGRTPFPRPVDIQWWSVNNRLPVGPTYTWGSVNIERRFTRLTEVVRFPTETSQCLRPTSFVFVSSIPVPCLYHFPWVPLGVSNSVKEGRGVNIFITTFHVTQW